VYIHVGISISIQAYVRVYKYISTSIYICWQNVAQYQHMWSYSHSEYAYMGILAELEYVYIGILHRDTISRDTGSTYRMLADTMYRNIGTKWWNTGAIYKCTGSIYRDAMLRDTGSICRDTG